jgi:iron complex transport system substrate-binding protein
LSSIRIHGPSPLSSLVSLSTVADAVLLEVCEPDRIVSFTGRSARSGARGYRFQGKPTVEGSGDLEGVLALHPDLVLVNGFGDPRPNARLRDAGLVVFDLGEMRGVRTLFPNVREIATLVGHPERGDHLVRALASDLAAVAVDVAPDARRRGMYLSVYGGHLFGGAEGTSYHDVIASAGLVDAASGYRDWPEYSVEQILAIDPDVIVTHRGMRDRICEHAGLTGLRACASRSAVVSLDDGLLGDPGPAMVDAARRVRGAVYGE